MLKAIKTNLSRTFGFQSVAENEREARIRRVFQAVLPRYDLMNDTMSFDIHRMWKRSFARQTVVRVEHVIVDLGRVPRSAESVRTA